MKLPTLLRRHAPSTDLGGVVRLDRRTKNLTKRIRPGEIAVIDHQDLDRVSAEALVQRGVAAVINVAPSVSGRYPTFGPRILLDAGIPLIDRADRKLFEVLGDGDRVLLDGGSVLDSDHEVLGKGELLDRQSLDAQLARAQAGLSDQIDAFTENTMNYLREEKDLLLEGVGVPDVRTVFEGRHVLIVVRGYDYREDLAALRAYITETRPLLIGVDGGADALLEAGYVPDIILGDMDSCSDAALHCGAELVVHAYRDGRAPGLDRIRREKLNAVVFPVLGTSEDAAMLLADSKGAQLIVAVGTHASLVEFLDKGRSGMASTFLTRLRVGPKLVDAKGVSRIYRSEVRAWQVLLLVLSALVALITAMAFTDFGRQVGDLLLARWNDIVYWVKELFT
jgi:uncharacterized membrane-anchored protein